MMSTIAEALNRHAAFAKCDDFMEVTRARQDIIKFYREIDDRYEACHEAHVNTENDLARVREECQRLRFVLRELQVAAGKLTFGARTVLEADPYLQKCCAVVEALLPPKTLGDAVKAARGGDPPIPFKGHA